MIRALVVRLQWPGSEIAMACLLLMELLSYTSASADHSQYARLISLSAHTTLSGDPRPGSVITMACLLVMELLKATRRYQGTMSCSAPAANLADGHKLILTNRVVSGRLERAGVAPRCGGVSSSSMIPLLTPM